LRPPRICPSFAGVFQFDDYNVIVNYPTVHSWEALLERAGGGVRPLLKASYTLNWTLGGGFHLLNIALHAINAALLFSIGALLFGNRKAALIAALLFALHPAATEAVTYISGRSSSLMALFYLGAMLAYLRGAHWSISSLLFVLAVATRETAVTLPAALLLCELCRGGRPAWREILRRQWAHWSLLLAGGVFLLLNQRYFDLVAYGYGERSLADNLVTQVGGISYLVLRLVSLHGYNIDPALPTLTEMDAGACLSGILVGIAFRRRGGQSAPASLDRLWCAVVLPAARADQFDRAATRRGERPAALSARGDCFWRFVFSCASAGSAFSLVLVLVHGCECPAPARLPQRDRVVGIQRRASRRGMRAGTTISATPTSSRGAPRTRAASTRVRCCSMPATPRRG
jgi:hypothetical protein